MTIAVNDYVKIPHISYILTEDKVMKNASLLHLKGIKFLHCQEFIKRPYYNGVPFICF